MTKDSLLLTGHEWTTYGNMLTFRNVDTILASCNEFLMALKRLNSRHPCRIPVSIISVPSMARVKGHLCDLGFGGARLLTAARLETEARIEFKSGAKKFTLDGYIIRRSKEGKRNLSGVEFHTYNNLEKDLSKLLAAMAREDKKKSQQTRPTIRMRRTL